MNKDQENKSGLFNEYIQAKENFYTFLVESAVKYTSEFNSEYINAIVRKDIVSNEIEFNGNSSIFHPVKKYYLEGHSMVVNMLNLAKDIGVHTKIQFIAAVRDNTLKNLPGIGNKRSMFLDLYSRMLSLEIQLDNEV